MIAAATASSQTEAVRVLVVDDVQSARSDARRSPQAASSSRFFEASTGTESDDDARTAPGIELVVTDYNMPDMGSTS